MARQRTKRLQRRTDAVVDAVWPVAAAPAMGVGFFVKDTELKLDDNVLRALDRVTNAFHEADAALFPIVTDALRFGAQSSTAASSFTWAGMSKFIDEVVFLPFLHPRDNGDIGIVKAALRLVLTDKIKAYEQLLFSEEVEKNMTTILGVEEEQMMAWLEANMRQISSTIDGFEAGLQVWRNSAEAQQRLANLREASDTLFKHLRMCYDVIQPDPVSDDEVKQATSITADFLKIASPLATNALRSQAEQEGYKGLWRTLKDLL